MLPMRGSRCFRFGVRMLESAVSLVPPIARFVFPEKDMPHPRFISCCSLVGCFILSGSVLALESGDEGGGSGGVCDPANQPWIYPAEAEDITDVDSWARWQL